MLYPYSGASGFKQNSPNNPSRCIYFLEASVICDSRMTYTYYILPFARKPKVINGKGVKYYITGTDEYTKYLANELSNYNNIQGCNVFMDRYQYP